MLKKRVAFLPVHPAPLSAIFPWIVVLSAVTSSPADVPAVFAVCRAASVGAHQCRRRHVVGAQRGVGRRQRVQLAAHRSDQNRQICHRTARRPQHLCLHAVHVSDRLHLGEWRWFSRHLLTSKSTSLKMAAGPLKSGLPLMLMMPFSRT